MLVKRFHLIVDTSQMLVTLTRQHLQSNPDWVNPQQESPSLETLGLPAQGFLFV
jgi:hypothetical protein